MKRRALIAVWLTACAAAGVLAAPAVGTLLIRLAGWTRTQTARKAVR